jgi:hypothetical protein
MNIFQGSSDIPYHLSVGGLITNSNDEICCHYFDLNSTASRQSTKRDLYLLMRETIASNESIDDALHRGALAEMGAKIKIGHFLGSKISTFPDNSNERIIRKTTIYFHLELIEQNESWRTAEIPEGQSVLMWLKPKMLIKRMETQQSDSHTGLDESQIVNNYLKTLAN